MKPHTASTPHRRNRLALRAALSVALALTVPACSSFHRYEDNCLNGHVSPNYGEVHATSDGGFEVRGSGVRQTPIEATQGGAPLRPGVSGQPADDYPKPAMRTFDCRQTGER